MAKIEHRVKDNPKLEQRVMSDGRTSLYLEYYRGRESVPVLDAEGNQEYYTEGKMAGRPKYKIRHSREKVSLDLYLVTEERRAAVEQAWREFAEVGEPGEVWNRILANIVASPFLKGTARDGRVWFGFDWLFRSRDNWLRVYEGNYSNDHEQQRSGSDPKLYVNHYWD